MGHVKKSRLETRGSPRHRLFGGLAHHDGLLGHDDERWVTKSSKRFRVTWLVVMVLFFTLAIMAYYYRADCFSDCMAEKHDRWLCRSACNQYDDDWIP